MTGATHTEGGSSCLNKLGLLTRSQVGRGDFASFQMNDINRQVSNPRQLDTQTYPF